MCLLHPLLLTLTFLNHFATNLANCFRCTPNTPLPPHRTLSLGSPQTYTLDDKHNGEKLSNGRHCTANFADPRRMLKMMNSRWGENHEFDYVILDYFFSPEGWARTRWTDAFYQKTLPMLVESDVLKPNGAIYLPNLECVAGALDCYEKSLSEHFSWNFVNRPKDNPLYRATERCEDELLRCPDKLTNESQMAPLHNFSDTPFIVLRRLNRSYLKRSATGEVIRKAASRYHSVVKADPTAVEDEGDAGAGPRNRKRARTGRVVSSRLGLGPCSNELRDLTTSYLSGS